ncbi:MAG: hypothetical protein VXZ78_04375, partial [Pseudomonadota bacterium]|nr:hypothetical protein [Pseudomonadota bacterium]
MPQLDPTSFPSQLFWLAVCFGTMLLVLSVFVLPRITRTLTARQGQIEGDLQAAEKLRADAEAALAAYDAALQPPLHSPQTQQALAAACFAKATYVS